jgi:hypothetical protein
VINSAAIALFDVENVCVPPPRNKNPTAKLTYIPEKPSKSSDEFMDLHVY